MTKLSTFKITLDRLEALAKLAEIFNPLAEAPRVKNENVNIKSEHIKQKIKHNNMELPRVKAETPRVDKLQRKQHFSPKNMNGNRKTKYGDHHQPHKYPTRSRTSLGVEYKGIPTPKTHTANNVYTLRDNEIKIKYDCNAYALVCNAVYCEDT